MNIPTGSPLWQAALLFFAAVFLLFEAWRGWRAGVVRSAINLAALVVSGIFGYLVGKAAAAMVGGVETPSGLVVGLVVGGGIAIMLFLAIWIFGAVFFKRTAHQTSGLFRLLWGGGGAVLGLLMGVLVVWGGISMVRGLGALAEGRAATSTALGKEPPRVATGLVTLKESLELGKAGEFLQTVDIIPNETYELIAQVSRLSSDTGAMIRFLEYPGIQAVIEHPRIAELLADPAVVSAAETHNYGALFTNKALIEAVRDPEFAKLVAAIDLQAALRHALAEEPSAAMPTPSPTPPAR